MVKIKKKHHAAEKLQVTTHLPTALVAGAAGFIGSHLCDALVSQNCLVYGIDNWTTGKKENLKHLMDHKQFVFIEHDLNQPLKPGLPQVDYVFHLAGVEEYLNGKDISLETLLVNSLGTKELLELARKNQAKFLLASTVNVFSGFLSATSLDHYFGAQHVSEEAYSHHEAKRFSEALTAEYVNRHDLDARVVRLAHPYGPRMDFAAGTELTKMFLALKNNKPLTIGGQGLTPLYPTFVSDIVYGLTKAMFSQSSQGHIYTLVNPQKTTTLNLAYLLKEANPDKDVKIEFANDEEQREAPLTITDDILKSQQGLGWSANIDLKQGIQKTLDWLKTGVEKNEGLTAAADPEEKSEPVYTAESLGLKPAEVPASVEIPAIPKPESKPSKKIELKLPKFPKIELKVAAPKVKNLSSRTKLWLVVLAVVILGILGPWVLTGTYAYTGLSALKKASETTDLSQIDKLTKLTASAESRLSTSRALLSRSRWSMGLVGLGGVGDNLDRLLSVGIKLSQGAGHLAEAGESGTLLTQIIFKNEEGNLTEALKRIQINLDQAYSELSFVESELQSGKELEADLSTPLNQKLSQLTNKLPELRKKINQARVVLPLIPGFIAEDSKKTYLMLFQNSAELRPTGGFIGSYGLLSFDQGKLLDFSVEDIYSADGQLQGFVEPPEPIAAAFGDNSWFFRDSNWDPDFTIAAGQAEWFLQKETGRNVDGVIAINLPAVKEILKATGPITLPDYNEEITAENLFERAEYQSEINFFPGSTQKKDFLGALGQELFVKLQNASGADLLKLAQAIEAALAQKQVLVYLHDGNSQATLVEQNWAGALFSPNLETIAATPVLSDYFFLVEANLGINKANYFLKRSFTQQLSILKNKEILSVATVTYQNQSPADAWPGGIYKSYVRAYLPKGATLVSIKAGEDRLPDDLIDQSALPDHVIFGFPITVPVKSSLTLEITYRLSGVLASRGRLAVVMPKQPGIIDDPLKVIINYPTFLTPVSVSPRGLASPQVITFDSDLTTDRVFTVDFVEQ